MAGVFRDPLSVLPAAKAPARKPVRMVSPAFTALPSVAAGGLLRFTHGVLQISGPDGLLIPAREIVAFEAMPCGARTRLRLTRRQAGETRVLTFWVRVADVDALNRLVAAVRASLVAAA
jgi:hypothetical protein